MKRQPGVTPQRPQRNAPSCHIMTTGQASTGGDQGIRPTLTTPAAFTLILMAREWERLLGVATGMAERRGQLKATAS